MSKKLAEYAIHLAAKEKLSNAQSSAMRTLDNEFTEKIEELKRTHNEELKVQEKASRGASRKTVDRFTHIMYVMRNVTYKKFGNDYSQAVKFLKENNLEWVLGLGVSNSNVEVLEFRQGKQLDAIRVKIVSPHASITDKTKSFYMPAGFLSASTWEIAKKTRSLIYSYKDKLKEAEVTQIENKLKAAKARIKASEKEVKDIEKQLNRKRKLSSELVSES